MQDPDQQYNLSNKNVDLSIGTILNNSFNTFGKNPFLFIAGVVFTIGLSFAISYAPILRDIASLSIVFSLVIQPVLMVGYYVICDKVVHNDGASFKDLFSAFQHQRGQIILANFLTILIFFIPMVLFGGLLIGVLGTSLLSTLSSAEEFVSTVIKGSGVVLLIGFLFTMAFVIYLSITFMFTGMFVYFKDLSAWDAINASRKMTSQKLLSFFGLAFALFFLNIGGMLCLGFGLLVTLPVSYIALYLAFNEMVELRETTENDLLIEHFISE